MKRPERTIDMLNSKITIRELELNNRLVAEPIVSNSGDSNGAPTVKSMEIYSQYAKSGVGMVVVEQHAVHPWGRNKLSQFRLYGDHEARTLKAITDLFKKINTPVIAQLNFSGAGASGKELLQEDDFKLVSPSAIRNPRDLIDADSTALTISEIMVIVKSFADASKRAIHISGYAGVQIYACHGYLISQFLSPITNKRNDKYGGDILGRSRLLIEITKAVRNAIPNSNVSVRLGMSDQMPGKSENGLTLDESCYVAKKLVDLGVDWLGTSGNHCIYGIGEDDNDTAYFAPYTHAIRNAIKSKVPVDCAGGIRSLKKAGELLKHGVCDLVGLGRPLSKDKQYAINLLKEYL